MPKPIEYRCQFCGKRTPARDWLNKKQTCPECGKDYDWVLAQDSE